MRTISRKFHQPEAKIARKKGDDVQAATKNVRYYCNFTTESIENVRFAVFIHTNKSRKSEILAIFFFFFYLFCSETSTQIKQAVCICHRSHFFCHKCVSYSDNTIRFPLLQPLALYVVYIFSQFIDHLLISTQMPLYTTWKKYDDVI